ncbi:uncharacterized protein LOC127727229 isoform X1 [Mytilus californianus]|uniref:uncharacterized protein LOC127727229 isoform X1 n=1 Tax=Mytilus californianus TaxID=6549 RepID=UPI0022485883|nr:uncharacterized protein LOC127727229 isoform X1 [Mytilus californianus]
MMEVYILTLWNIYPLFLLFLTVATACVFPEDIRGRWYQSRYGELEISHNEITRKGTCAQNEDNKYLLYNRSRNCYKCLVITKWHKNILQYKESYCLVENDINALCERIHGEAELHTVVRIPSIPVACPFQGYYSFKYSNSTTHNRQCENPLSEIRACADDSKFKFIYRKCPGMPETSNKELDFQCLATWESGEKFLYGKFQSPDLTSREQMYRCFMHNFFSMSGDMSISADATCQGLQSPTVGVSTMKLDKEPDDHRWPLQRCSFPKFFIHHKRWRDLSGQYVLEVESQMFRIKDKHAQETIIFDADKHRSDTWMMLRCINDIDKTLNSQIQEFIVHATDDKCTSKYRCLRLKKRHNKVIELHIGEAVDDRFSVCSDSQFLNALKFIIIQNHKHMKPTSCPQKGSFRFADKASDCEGQFISGCRMSDEIEIQHYCPRTSRRSGSKSLLLVDIYQCLVSWQEDNVRFVIAHHPSRKSAKCLAYVESADGIDVHEDEFCRDRLSVITSRKINYALFKPADGCGNLLPPVGSAAPNGYTSDRDNNNGEYPDKTKHNSASGIIDAGSNRSSTQTISLVLLFALTILSKIFIR